MGGVVIVAQLARRLRRRRTWSPSTPPTVSGLLVLFLMAGLGLVGFLDDFIKIRKQRSLGLRAAAKIAGQAARRRRLRGPRAAVPQRARAARPASHVGLVRARHAARPGLLAALGGVILFVIWANIIVAGTSNGVNLTDGLDGLATGASIMVFGAYVLIGIWQFNQNCQWQPGHQVLRGARPARPRGRRGRRMGACFGFLWWNASPAKIFMGDTGSLALGGALAGLAILTRTELLLVILGGLFVIITALGDHPGGLLQDSPANGSSGWRRSSTTSSCWAGPRSRSSSGSGSSPGCSWPLGLGLFYAEWVVGAG